MTKREYLTIIDTTTKVTVKYVLSTPYTGEGTAYKIASPESIDKIKAMYTKGKQSTNHD